MSIFKKSDDNVEVHLYLKSKKDYGNHSTNVLRDCAASWSDPQSIFSHPGLGQFTRQIIDRDSDDYIYYVNAYRGQLRRANLGYLINDPEVAASSYMTYEQELGAYKPLREYYYTSKYIA